MFEGGEFDLELWIEFVKVLGVKFVGLVVEYYDGYLMWESKVNEWNFVVYGLKMDFVKFWEGFVCENGMKFFIVMY